MGNHAGKDNHGSTGSPLDFFHTPPTTPSEAELTAMALSSSASTNKVPPKGTPSPETPRSSATPPTTSPITDWAQKMSVPSEWAVISVEGVTSPESTGSDAAARCGKAAGTSAGLGSPVSPPASRGSPSPQSWQERDSGVEPQPAPESPGEEMSLVLLSLMEHYRASLGLSPGQDVTTGAVELLRRLVRERDELVQEVSSLKDTLRAERAEWYQFQCDLQVAVSVADRLRVEAEQALGMLQGSYRAAEYQMTQALSRQQEKDRELESLRAEHRDACRRLSELSLQQQRERTELDALRNAQDMTVSDKEAEGKDSEEGQTKQEEEPQFEVKDLEENNKAEAEAVEKQTQGDEANQDLSIQSVTHDAEDTNGAGKMQLTGKGVAEAYLRSLVAIEKRKEEGCGQRDPRRIVMLAERSWSLSRLPLPVDTPSENGTSQKTSTTLPLCKKEEPAKGRRMDRILQRQDSWSSFYTKKQDEDQNSDFIKARLLSTSIGDQAIATTSVSGTAYGGIPQDGFSALLRRHGGSRRNSLLRWCQSRTQGYKNIEITNFSSSWEDGLAFCAVYHTYLPSYIPYDSLSPADKKENLGLAFQTGQSVGIADTLTVEEMLKAGGPDWQRVLGYVESIFRHFEM